MSWEPIRGKPANSIVGGKNACANIQPDGPAGCPPPRIQMAKALHTWTAAEVT